MVFLKGRRATNIIGTLGIPMLANHPTSVAREYLGRGDSLFFGHILRNDYHFLGAEVGRL